jgi:uncharacterized repeat protein (TIGR02543 family)
MRSKIFLGIISIILTVGMTLIGCDQDLPVMYTVTFNSNGGSEVTKITGISSGATVKLPQEPTRENYSFVGWFIDDITFQNEFNEASIITDNLKVYAKWSADLINISFLSVSEYDALLSDTERTLKLIFDKNIEGLEINNIIFTDNNTGAEKGILTKTETLGEYTLTIMDITNAGSFKITVEKSGFVFIPGYITKEISYHGQTRTIVINGLTSSRSYAQLHIFSSSTHEDATGYFNNYYPNIIAYSDTVQIADGTATFANLKKASSSGESNDIIPTNVPFDGKEEYYLAIAFYSNGTNSCQWGGLTLFSTKKIEISEPTLNLTVDKIDWYEDH